MSLSLVIIVLSSILLIHSIFNLLSMLFSWNDPHTNHVRKSPDVFVTPKLSFSLIIPVRNEPQVIGDTLRAMSKIIYPVTKYEIIVVCRQDDILTLEAIRDSIQNYKISNCRTVIANNEIDNKPKALNLALKNASNDIIAIFDAEDEPHKDILNIINTTFISQKSDVIQSGVQLMNYHSTWFSAYNVLEYYFWFKSSLHFFTEIGVVPLGGNTVFLKKKILEDINGWDEEMLTEDADLGIRLSLTDSKINIIYDELHVTKEETPSTVSQFIKQRTRWNQGFLQIFFKFKWLKLSSLKKRLFTGYLLFMPVIQALWIIYLPLTISANFFLSIPVGWAIFSLLPGYVLFIQLVMYNYGLFQFIQDYKFKYSPVVIFQLLIFFFPYQLILSISACRAVIHQILGKRIWEKTTHLNIHRNNLNA